MIKHIVFWTFHEQAEGSDKAANLCKAKELLDACSDIAPGTLAFEVAIAQDPACTYDLCLYSVFESRSALDAYQNHPRHVALQPFMKANRKERQCMDYEV